VERKSLSDQLATRILEAIETGRWKKLLPGERQLSKEYQVSRSTLRAALRILREEGYLRSRQGSGNFIVRTRLRKERRDPPRQVGLLIAKASSFLTSSHERLLLEIRERLAENNCSLKKFSGARFLRPNPDNELDKVVSGNPMSCWILLASTERIQRWFSKQSIPCMILGSRFKQVRLPAIDVDYEAVGRHAAGKLLSYQHRRIAMISGSLMNAGIRACEHGFVEEIERKRNLGEELRIKVIRHSHTVEGLEQKLDGLMKRENEAPSEVFITSPEHYLYTFSYLAQYQLRVPSEVSLLCRDEDSVFNFLKPRPCHYRVDTVELAKHIMPALNRLIRGQPVGSKIVQLIPEYEEGESVALNRIRNSILFQKQLKNGENYGKPNPF